MSLVAISKGLDTQELFEVRITLETAAASFAAERRSDTDLQNIKSILIKMDEYFVNQDEEAEIQFDFLFHQSIVKASQNRMLLLLIEVISDLLGEQIRTTRSELATSYRSIKTF